ncbi:MAG: lysostaphin resistance A-like protein [Hyphomicrobiales bacterium]
MINYRHYPNIKQCWGIFGMTFLGMLLATEVNIFESFIGNDITRILFYLVGLGLPVFFAYKMRKDWSGCTKLEVRTPEVGVLWLIIVTALGFILAINIPFTELIPVPDFLDRQSDIVVSDYGFTSLLTAVVIAPILEEVLFRGIMLDGLLKKYSPKKAILFSSFLFGLSHFNPSQFIFCFLSGILLGWAYYNTRNLIYPIVIHVINNSLSFLLFYLGFNNLEELFITTSNLLIAVVVGFVILAGSIYLLNRIFITSGKPDYTDNMPIKEKVSV